MKFKTGSWEDWEVQNRKLKDREVENRYLRTVGRLRIGSWEDWEIKNRKLGGRLRTGSKGGSEHEAGRIGRLRTGI
jgi:hypothetical protein